MYTHKLIEYLKTFDRKEMTRFREFACSPYFNKHEKVRQLIEYLSDIFPDFNEKNCDRESLFQKIIGEATFNQVKIAVIFTYAMRLLKSFLIEEELRQEDQEQERRLLFLRQLRRRKLYPFFEKEFQKSEKELTQQSRRDSWYFQQHFELVTEADNYFTETRLGKKDENLQVRQFNLDIFYLAEKLRDACEMHVRSNLLKMDFQASLLDYLLQEMDEHPDRYAEYPVVQVYYRIYRMLKEEDVQYYYDALPYLKKLTQLFSIEETKTIYNYFQNYCAQQINRGKYDFLKEIFKLYQLQLQDGLLLEKGFLSEWHYKNIVTVGLLLEETAWVKSFIEKYKEKLPPESVDNAYRFNLASYYYATQQLDQVLELLVKVEYSDLRYSLGAKVLLLRTYYDLDEYEALHSLTDSFRQYLSRNKLLADSRRKSYIQLFKLTRKVAQLRTRKEYQNNQKWGHDLKKLEAEIQEKSIFNKPWLMEKVQELKKLMPERL